MRVVESENLADKFADFLFKLRKTLHGHGFRGIYFEETGRFDTAEREQKSLQKYAVRVTGKQT